MCIEHYNTSSRWNVLKWRTCKTKQAVYRPGFFFSIYESTNWVEKLILDTACVPLLFCIISFPDLHFWEQQECLNKVWICCGGWPEWRPDEGCSPRPETGGGAVSPEPRPAGGEEERWRSQKTPSGARRWRASLCVTHEQTRNRKIFWETLFMFVLQSL